MMAGTREQAAEAYARGDLKPRADYLAPRVREIPAREFGTEAYTGPWTKRGAPCRTAACTATR